jgi:hypothetical protein
LLDDERREKLEEVIKLRKEIVKKRRELEDSNPALFEFRKEKHPNKWLSLTFKF